MPFYELVCIARHNIVEVRAGNMNEKKRADPQLTTSLEQLEGSFKDLRKASA